MFKFLKNALLLIALVLIALPWALPPDSFFLLPHADMFARIGYALVAAFMIHLLFKSEPPVKKPEPEITYLMGTPEKVTLFEASDGAGDYCRTIYGFYSTVENAFLAHPKASVRPVEYYQIGKHYINSIAARLVDLTVDHDVPKPKDLPA